MSNIESETVIIKLDADELASLAKHFDSHFRMLNEVRAIGVSVSKEDIELQNVGVLILEEYDRFVNR